MRTKRQKIEDIIQSAIDSGHVLGAQLSSLPLAEYQATRQGLIRTLADGIEETMRTEP